MRDGDRLILPNDAAGFITDELKERLAQGIVVTIAFGGNSMLPLIDGHNDLVRLAPLDGEVHRGEVYLFVYKGRCVVHRLVCIKGDTLVFRGDNSRGEERVGRGDVLARLSAVVHKDGTEENCDTVQWRRKSHHVALFRSLRNLPFKTFGRQQRRWERWVYIALLVILMWAPVGGLGLELDSYVLHIRMDHLLHASVYVPFVFFLMDVGFGRSRRLVLQWLLGLLFAAVTETGQLLLFYRGFDPSDLVANFIGVTVGWLLVLLWKYKNHKISLL